MMQSDAINWSVAILVSLFIHSVILMNRGTQFDMEIPDISRSPLITHLSFKKPVASVMPDIPPPVKKHEPVPVKKIEPKLIEKKIIKQEPVKKKPAKNKQVKKKQIVKHVEPVKKVEPARRETSAAQIQSQPASRPSDSLLRSKRQQYLQTLLNHIESFKYYPRSARRRSLEGDVKVSFKLRNDGYYEQLILDGRHTVLVKAARQALEAAMPLPVPAKDIGVSGHIEFVMAYSLSQ